MGKLTSYNEITTPADGDKFPAVDVSDTTHAATGTTKWMLWSTFRTATTILTNKTLTAHKWVKGADIASADPLVLGTDGSYFDVTGTMGFASITVAAGTFFMLQFDGALVLTHHATNLDLPGEADIKTAGGDVLIGFATGANTVQCLSYVRAASVINVAGKQTIYVPAAAMRPTVSNGCAAITDVETTSGRPDMQVLDFDATADEHGQFQVAFPKSWNLGTVTFQVFWTSTATDTDGVAWAVQAVAVANDGTIDVAYGTAVVVTDNNISAAEDLLVTAESAVVTIGGTPADDEMCFFRIFRDVSDAVDTMTEDARLIGVKLLFTTDLENDA